ncbi:MAG: hypothetical protein J6V81_03610 [Bacteroidales bacterium]|nr:hypothetical protein [Bacteroidales bacterium]
MKAIENTSCSPDFVQFIVDQCSGAGILFGLICDNNLYIKVTDAGEALPHWTMSSSPTSSVRRTSAPSSPNTSARPSASRYSSRTGSAATPASPTATPSTPT